MTSLDVICVNWNSGPQLAACLASLARADRTGFTLGRVIVVDNASTDGSARVECPELPLTTIANPTNRGFAAACNQGARGSTSNYLLFLNPDTVLGRDSLTRPVGFLESAQGAGVAVCGVRLVGEHGAIARSCARFPTPRTLFAVASGLDRLLPRRFPGVIMQDWDHLDSREVDHVIGAFYLTRRAVFEALGGFDERYFVYLEDLDYSLRARLAGWRSYYLASAQAYHRGGGTSEQVRAQRLVYLLRSRLRYARRHFSRTGAAAVAVATLVVEPFVRLGAALAHGRLGQAGETLQAYWMLARSLARPPLGERRGRG